MLHPDHGRLIENAVRWVSRGRSPLKVTGPGVVDVAVWKQQSSITVHVVNLTNPMMMRAPFREILPVGPQEVALELPDGVKPKGVRFLVSGSTPKWTVTGRTLRVVTPPIGLHEVVALDL